MPVHDSKATEARLLSIIEAAMDAIITVDESQRVVLFNNAAELLFGVKASEALGAPIDRFIPARFRAVHANYIPSFGSRGVTMRKMGRLGTLTGLRSDGTEFPIEVSISYAIVDGAKLYTAIVRDISERKKLEEQLLHAQKMEVIGRLAGGIAHDFNNLLMAIFNYLMLATKGLEPDHPSSAALTQVHEAATRAATLTRQLLTFARKQVVKPRVVALNEVVSNLEPMLRRLISEDVSLETSLAEDAGNVRADPTQLEQVVINLVVNARDAMPQGGRISVRTGSRLCDESYCERTPGATVGAHALLTVQDSGTGMTDEVKRRIFEPFFTTKEPGKGTGLGLAICHGIVTQAGGHIIVDSAPGSGTSISILIPSVEASQSPRVSTDAPPPPAHGSETVLFAEDSSVVRELITNALRQSGYTVLAASSGSEALRMAQEHIGPISLLVTDVMMPGMRGTQLATEVRRKIGSVPVLFISGSGQDSLSPEESVQLEQGLMSKPFTTDALLRRIRVILDHSPRRP